MLKISDEGLFSTEEQSTTPEFEQMRALGA